MSKLAKLSQLRHKNPMSLRDLIQRYKQFDFTGFTPVYASANGHAQRIGWTKPELAAALAGYGYVFTLQNNILEINPELLSYQARTDAVDAVLLQASGDGVLPTSPDYSEMGGVDWYPVGGLHEPLFEIRRFYSVFLGVQRYGSRINAYHDGHMWVAKRGDGVHEYPGYWDTLVGAGQVAGRTILEHTLVEAHEEAGLSADDCRGLKSASMFHIARQTKKGFYYDENVYLFDLDLPSSITPKIMQSWETAAIELWPFDKVLQTLYHTEEFRPEAMFSLVDFFIRHGVITPDNEPDFDAICFGLRSLLSPAYEA